MQKSNPTLQRLPVYLRILKRLEEEKVDFVSSTFLANELNYNSIKVRKDLAFVSKEDGKAGVGFNVKNLIDDIESMLNLNKREKMIVVGVGNLGKALMNYENFESNVEISMGFARDEKKCDDRKVKHISKMKKYIKDNKIKLAVITVSKENAQEVCDLLIDSGIKGIWNFSPVNLKVPDDVVLRNEDLDASLAILLKQLS